MLLRGAVISGSAPWPSTRTNLMCSSFVRSGVARTHLGDGDTRHNFSLAIEGFSPSASPQMRSCHKLVCNAAASPNGSNGPKMFVAITGATGSNGFTGIVETVKWAFTSSPPSLESAAIATSTIFLAGAPVLLAGLSLPGYACAYLLGLLTWRAFGWQGTFIVSVYFVLGTLATKVKIKQKEAAGIAEKRSGRRGPESVLGSWTAGAVCAAATVASLGGLECKELWCLGFLASFCTKLSDTISSEIGKAFGKTTYLVTSFSVVPRGTEGAVSLEGTLAGLVASIILAAVAYYINLTNQSGAVICVVAAQVANFCESYIGAALQGRAGFEWITNDVANVVNITIGASLAAALRILIG